MTYAEKIQAIRDRITLFGGTLVSLNGCSTIVGYNKNVGEDYYMLYDITVNGHIIGKTKSGSIIKIPINWLSEFYLHSVYDSYMKACKEQLTENAFSEIEEVVK